MKKRIENKAYRIFYKYFGKLRSPFKSNRILIVRVDGIGDYILFRNYLAALRNAPSYSAYTFTLLGNVAFKTLTEKYDANLFHECIWVNPAIFFDTANKTPKIKLAIQLKLKGFDIAISPSHSRIWETDEFVSRTGAKKIIGSNGDDSNYRPPEKYKESFNFYTKLIDVPDTSQFEFFRTRAFFKSLLGLPKNETELKLPSDATKDNSEIKVVIFPGARYQFRRWNTKNFSSLINEINNKNNFSVHFVIAGSDDEKYLAEEIAGQLENDIHITDLTGLLTLPQLVDEIKGAHLLISNETSAVHIAAATGTAAICISNGNHFGRFNPYPKSLAPNIFTFYPDERFYKPEFRNTLIEECRRQSELDINLIEASPVAKKAIEFLMENHITETV